MTCIQIKCYNFNDDTWLCAQCIVFLEEEVRLVASRSLITGLLKFSCSQLLYFTLLCIIYGVSPVLQRNTWTSNSSMFFPCIYRFMKLTALLRCDIPLTTTRYSLAHLYVLMSALHENLHTLTSALHTSIALCTYIWVYKTCEYI